jgi:hypothetical protein
MGKPSNENSSIAPSQTSTLVNRDDPSQNFTATGRPMSTTKPSALGNIPGGFVPQAPQFLPVKFHDDAIIPVPVIAAAPAPEVISTAKPSGFMSRMKNIMSSKKEEEGKLRVVYMPRREYMKYFAKDDEGVYVGSEAQRVWTDEALDEMFGVYQEAGRVRRGRQSVGDVLASGLAGGLAAA